VWSYFEDLVIRKIIVEVKFNMNARFSIYSFFSLRIYMHVSDIIVSVLFCMDRMFPLGSTTRVVKWLNCGTNYSTGALEVMG